LDGLIAVNKFISCHIFGNKNAIADGIPEAYSPRMATERLQVPIDRFGRIVLPKSIRDRLGVSEGTEFDVEETEDAIVLKPVQKKAKMTKKKGWWVVESEGSPITVDDVNQAVSKSRRENREP